MDIYLYNTLSRKKEKFVPLRDDFVRVYDCGPTVYWYAHIGNMWRYLASDFLRRVLEYNGYKVKQVMNITDVGHLTEDDLLAADTGEDKMEVAARREKKTVWEIAEFYTKAYFKDRRALNILDPVVTCKATEHIPEMIKLIQVLEKKGYAYRLPDRVCFDVSKFKEYGKLSGKKLDELRVGVRLEPIPGKKNPYDFSLWILDEKHLMKWDSPWGVGYPGWHIECSAMSMKYLGEQLDIHSGGEDNIFPHHENEIAQSEAATGKQFVRFWFHVRFNQVNGRKMSKSKGTLLLLSDLVKRGFEPLAYRYLCLTSHYRSRFNFTFASLAAAQQALNRMRFIFLEVKEAQGRRDLSGEKEYQSKFRQLVNDDVGTPQALGLAWQMLADPNLSDVSKKHLLLDFDKVFGLRLGQYRLKIPKKVNQLLKERERLRQQGKFAEADKVREKIAEEGFAVEDTPKGSIIKPLPVDFEKVPSYNRLIDKKD
jgi:cysteinyl-tRNA synthetase